MTGNDPQFDLNPTDPTQFAYTLTFLFLVVSLLPPEQRESLSTVSTFAPLLYDQMRTRR